MAGLDRTELARKTGGARVAERGVAEHLCASGGPGSGSLTADSRQNIFIAWNTLCTSRAAAVVAAETEPHAGLAQVAGPGRRRS